MNENSKQRDFFQTKAHDFRCAWDDVGHLGDVQRHRRLARAVWFSLRVCLSRESCLQKNTIKQWVEANFICFRKVKQMHRRCLKRTSSGETRIDKEVSGDRTEFVDGGSMHRKIYMNRVLLTRLVPGQNYSWALHFSIRCLSCKTDVVKLNQCFFIVF